MLVLEAKWTYEQRHCGSLEHSRDAGRKRPTCAQYLHPPHDSLETIDGFSYALSTKRQARVAHTVQDKR